MTTPQTVDTTPQLPREVWVLVAGAFLVALGFGLVAPVLPTYASSFGVSAAGVSVIISAFAFTRLIFAPVAGRLLKRLPERPIYLAGLLIVAASSVGIAYAPGYAGLLIARSLGGVGSTMFTIAGLALLFRVTPPELRGRASAAYGSGFLIGSIGGPLFGGLLVGWSVKAPFLIYAVILVITAVLVQLLLRRIPPPVLGDAAPVATLGETLRERPYQAVLASNFAVGWAVFGIRMALFPLFIVQVLGASEAVAGYALTAFAIGNALVLALVGRWVDIRGRKPAMIIGLVLSSATLGLIGVSASVWMVMVLCVIGGVGSGMMTPAQQAVVADVLRGRSGGPVLALYQMMGDLGSVVGPILAGVLVDSNGYPIAFGIGAVVVAATVLLWLRAPETLPARAAAGKMAGNTTPSPRRWIGGRMNRS